MRVICRLIEAAGAYSVACFHPLQAYQCTDGSVVFVERAGHDVLRSLLLPCGQCVGCRLERSRQWAIRVMHEASLYDANSFVTLTYSDEHVPSNFGLRYRDYQLFMKRLRKRFGYDTGMVYNGKPVMAPRFYMCGEYGEDFGRPHYHACLFGLDFPDKLHFKRTSAGNLYTSAALSELWPMGFSLIGSVTFESAAYVARYCMAKVTGERSESWYSVVEKESGQITCRTAEFNHMSNRPGIAAGWFSRFSSDIYPNGDCVVNGRRVKAPRYYDRLYARENPEGMDYVAYKRYLRGLQTASDNSEERLAVKEQVATARAARFGRKLT